MPLSLPDKAGAPGAWLALGAALALSGAALAANPLPPAEPQVLEVEADSGHLELMFQLPPGDVATVATTDLAVPRMAIGSPVAGTGDPFAASGSQLFRMISEATYWDRALYVEVEGGGEGVDLYVGYDGDGNRRPSASEVQCVVTDIGLEEGCDLNAVGPSHWALVHRRSGGPSELRMRWYYPFYGYVRQGEAGIMSSRPAYVSAPGRADAGGRFPVRFAWSNSGMGVGEPRIARVRVTSGDIRLERRVRLVRTGTSTVQTNPFLNKVLNPTTITLAPGESHGHMAVVVPAGSRRISLNMDRVGPGNVGFWIRPSDDEWSGPVLPQSPALDGEGAYAASPSAEVPGRLEIAFRGDLPSLWYLTPVNYSTYPITVRVTGNSSYDGEPGPEVRSGSYFNPDRGGHGIFLYRSGTVPVLLWYTYDDEGNATWIYGQGDDVGDSTWTTLYRAAWLGDRQRLYPVGNARLRAGTDGRLVFDYELDGRRGSERLAPFLTGCPGIDGLPLDASGHWFDPARAGTGYSVQVHPQYEFISAFVYDALGRPRFLVAERGGAFDAGAGDLVLEQLEGFAPFGAHRPPLRTAVGLLSRRYADGQLAEVSVDAEFEGTIPGAWTATDVVRPLSTRQGCEP